MVQRTMVASMVVTIILEILIFRIYDAFIHRVVDS